MNFIFFIYLFKTSFLRTIKYCILEGIVSIQNPAFSDLFELKDKRRKYSFSRIIYFEVV